MVTGTEGEVRQDEHDGVTVSTNGALFVIIYSAAAMFILNAGQHTSAGHSR
ncbi:hypothetical protein [Saccharopolyspora sp. ASAGF58]|uniref:hypothetical protein n=1 Tax=Saccharopolyspora sp. ASAGF58 TaxID=2719023 RepID=UPI001445A824|nr:hypothetical protein [Saccharopolyspora sp. ASAGF58]